ncbi:MAG: hypothetical protein ACTSVV_10485 [Promethearchaeota archaeon]
MKTIVYFRTLMKYAKKLGEARLSNNKEEIKKAKIKHDEYRDICLKADKMSLL